MKGIFEKNDLKIKITKTNGFKAFSPMFHPHMEIIYVVSGSINVSIDGISKTLLPGEMCITFPYVIHSYENSPDTEAVILLFDPSLTDLFEKKLFSHKPVSPYISQASAFLPLFEKIMYYSSYDDADYLKMANVYLTALVGEILFSVELRRIEDFSASSVRKILIYCLEHYTENITEKSVSENLYISQSNITKTFAKKLGCSFKEYINHLRVNKAKYQLENTDKKIIEIMYECGFKNQSSFNRVFLQANGTTPSEFRKEVKKVCK